MGVEGHNMHAIEDAGSQDTGTEGGDVENPIDQETNQPVDESGRAAAADGGTEDPEAGGAGEGEEGTPGEAADGAEPGAVDGPALPFDPEAFKAGIIEEVRAAVQPPAPAAKELTEEEWAAKEQEWGVPRSTIKAATMQSVQVYNRVLEAMEARLAPIMVSEAVRQISREKGYGDAVALRPGIDKYLSKFPVQHHANPDLLRMAVVYARGLAAQTNVRKARNANERNLKIAGAGRPGAGGGGTAPRSAAPRLTATQSDVARKFNMSDAEYAKLKSGGRAIAV